MFLDKVQITHFRNIQSAHIEPAKHINFILGENGSGKSSLLEALHFLGFGRSFRTSKYRSVIQDGQSQFVIFCQAQDQQAESYKIGLSRSLHEDIVCNINGQRSKRLADLVSILPVQIFTPQSSDLLLGSPSARRRFVDWGLFHVEPNFLPLYSAYNKVLKQRNALLKKLPNQRTDSTDLKYWTEQVSIYGERLNASRIAYIESFVNAYRGIVHKFLPEFGLEISYNKGWDNELSLTESLSKRREMDMRYGSTTVGPHKADFIIKLDKVNAVERLSRGQLRMLVAALQLAQTQHLYQVTGKSGIFLLDDIGAELDQEKRELFIDALVATETQIFITAIEESHLPFLAKYNERKMFHVKHGQVTEER